MTKPGSPGRSFVAPGDANVALVWIDSREAIIVRWQADEARIERVKSDVPAHHRATGHVRHDPSFRHEGGGPSQTAGDSRRIEHLERFLDRVAALIRDHENLLLIGPGTVREHLERRIRGMDARRRAARTIVAETGARSTQRQLIARLRRHLGDEPRRRSVGAYSWTEPLGVSTSGDRTAGPRRVIEKPRPVPGA